MVDVMNIVYSLSIISGFCNAQSSLIPYCPSGDPCDPPPPPTTDAGGTFQPPPESFPVNCSEPRTCYNDGCYEICSEPRCTFTYTINGTTTPADECECYYEQEYNVLCSEDEFCCQDNCTNVCKEIRYAKVVCNDELPPFPSNLFECFNMRCSNDNQCPSFEKCCPGHCPFFDVCKQYKFKRAICPSDVKEEDDEDDEQNAPPCDNHEDCTDDEKLCCRLYSNSNETYCREPVLVDDDIVIYVVG